MLSVNLCLHMLDRLLLFAQFVPNRLSRNLYDRVLDCIFVASYVLVYFSYRAVCFSQLMKTCSHEGKIMEKSTCPTQIITQALEETSFTTPREARAQ